MKIAIIAAANLPIPAIQGGATETLMTHLINVNEKYKKLSIDVYCYNSPELENYCKEYKYTNFMLYNGDRNISKMKFFVKRIIRILSLKKINLTTDFCNFCIKKIRTRNYDYVIVEGNVFQIIQLKKHIKSKIIYHAHTDVLNVNTPNCKKMVSNCNKIITVSNFIKNRIIEIDKTKEKNTFVLKNCINLDTFKIKDNPKFKKEFYNNNNLNDDDFIILFCGRVEPNKGIDKLVDALQYLNGNYKLIVIGSSWYGKNNKTKFIESLEKKAMKYKNRIIFTGYLKQNELAKYYNLANICVFPSISNEAAGLVIIESLACGIPVIVTKKGGMVEYMDENVGYIIDTKDNLAKNISNIIKKIDKNKIEYIHKKKNCREYASKFNTDDYYNNFIKILEE